MTFNFVQTANTTELNAYNALFTTYDMGANNTFQFGDLGFAGADYSVVGVGDFNGDRTDDILWLNSQTQQVGYYQMGAAGFM